MPPPGGGDPRTTVGASVRCKRSSGPIAADVVGAIVSAQVTVSVLALLNFVAMFTGDGEDGEDSDLGSAAFVLSMPTAAYVASAIYGGVQVSKCKDAHLASARAKLRGEPLRLEGVKVELPARRGAPAQPPAQPSPPPAGPPSTMAPLPNP